jgi:molybdate transport system regulatory protein
LNKPKPPQTEVALEQALASTLTDKRIEILRAVGQLGSISQAARANDVSYKAAWQAVETLGNLAGCPLIDKAIGGAGGGGARLTPQGQALLEAAEHLNQAKAVALAQVRGRTGASDAITSGITNMGFRMSMRNQIPCKVHAIEHINGSVRVWLEVADGQHLASRITTESLELLDLKPNLPVVALCKATAVTIAQTIVAIGEVCTLKGEVCSRPHDSRDRQASLAIGKNIQLSGFVEPGSDLKPKQTAMAAIAESAVVIGLPD